MSLTDWNMNKPHIYITERACFKAQEQGKEFAEAFLLVCKLRSLTRHPILFNFKSNLTSFRLITGYSDKKFRQLINQAFTNKLISLEGNHLRLLSKTQERHLFKLRSRHKRHEVAINKIEPFYQISVLKNNLKKQDNEITKKERLKSKGCSSGVPNHDITLSTRNIAKLLFVSQPYAHRLSKKLHGFGLRLIPNRYTVSKSEYYAHKHFGSPHRYMYRFNQETGEYYIRYAQLGHVTHYLNWHNC